MAAPSMTFGIPADFHPEHLFLREPNKGIFGAPVTSRPDPRWSIAIPASEIPHQWAHVVRPNQHTGETRDFALATSAHRPMIVCEKGGRFKELFPEWGEAPLGWQILERYCIDRQAPPTLAFVGRAMQANVSFWHGQERYNPGIPNRPQLMLQSVNVLGDLTDMGPVKAAVAAWEEDHARKVGPRS